MQGYQRADLASVNQLIDCLAPRLIRFFERQVHDRTRAEDLVQDCWMRVHKSRHTYRPGSPLLPWVYAIARRTGIDGYRRARRSLAFQQEFDEGSSDAASPRGLSPETKIGLQQELASLSIKERQAIELLKVEGLSLEDVASMTGASVNAVKQRAHRAYLKLRKSLGGPK
jgi:RNA polymerase sigma-70 factor (ECF subfamily)